MTTKLKKWGNSQGIIIPKYLMEAIGLEDNDNIEIKANGKQLIVEKNEQKPKRKTISELFKGYEGNYQPEEVDWGEAVGKEVW